MLIFMNDEDNDKDNDFDAEFIECTLEESLALLFVLFMDAKDKFTDPWDIPDEEPIAGSFKCDAVAVSECGSTANLRTRVERASGCILKGT